MIVIVTMIVTMMMMMVMMITTRNNKNNENNNNNNNNNNNTAKETIIVDIAVPGDSNILQKETEKCEKHQDLAREIQRIWKSRTKVVPVVVGALGSVSKKLAGHLEQLGIKNRTRTMQKSALLGSAHILRKVLEVWGLEMRLDWIFLPRENPCAKFYIIMIIIIIMNKTCKSPV